MNNLLGKFIKLQMLLSLASFAVMIILNLSEIVLRATINYSLIWIQDITLLLLAWMIFTGVSCIVYEKKDIVVSFIYEKMPSGLQKGTDFISTLLILFFLIFFSYNCYLLILKQVGDVTLSSGVPLQLYTIPVLVNALTNLIIYLRELGQVFRSRKGGIVEWK